VGSNATSEFARRGVGDGDPSYIAWLSTCGTCLKESGDCIRGRGNVFGEEVDLDAVAGREDRHLVDGAVFRQLGDSLVERVGFECHTLADGERGGFVFEADGDKGHE
jgi:hypothetical protein